MRQAIGFFLVFILLFSNISVLKAQSETEDFDVPVRQRFLPVTLRFDGGIGFLAKPVAMKNNFISIGDYGLASVFGLGKGLNAGLQFRYTGFQVNRFAAKVTDPIYIKGNYEGEKPISTTYSLLSPGIYIGYDYFISPYSMFSFFLNPSMAFVRYTQLRTLNKPDEIAKYAQYSSSDYNQKTFSLQPGISFHYFFDENAGMTIKVGYTRTWSKFTPEPVRLGKEAIDFQDSDLNGPVQFFSVCLGFAYSFRKID